MHLLQVFVIEDVDMSMPTSEITVKKTSAVQKKKYHLSTQWSETFTLSGIYTTTEINTTMNCVNKYEVMFFLIILIELKECNPIFFQHNQ